MLTPKTMLLELSISQLVTICAIVNGFVFSLLLLDKRENRRANRFLALLIFSMCLTFTPYMLDPSIWHTYRWLVWMPFSLSYWIGPAFYFYVRTLTLPNLAFKRKDLWHFAPIILNYIHSAYHAFVGDSNPYPWFHHLAEILESFAILSIIIYLVLCFHLTNRYQYTLLNRVSNLELIDLQWIKRIIVVLAISFLCIFLYLGVSSGLWGKHTLDQWGTSRSIILLFYAAILYWLTISGFRQAQTFDVPPFLDQKGGTDEASQIIQRLQKVMTEQHSFRNPTLSLSDLSKISGISERGISGSINAELDKNFYQFINEYRVEEMKRNLVDPDSSHFTIMSLAFEAGFNSKASFNRVFKASTGMTPKAYREAKS